MPLSYADRVPVKGSRKLGHHASHQAIDAPASITHDEIEQEQGYRIILLLRVVADDDDRTWSNVERTMMVQAVQAPADINVTVRY